MLWSLNYTWEAIRVVGRRCSHCGRPGRFVVGGPRLGGNIRGLVVCVPCVRRGRGPGSWLRVVWRAVGAGILHAAATDNPREATRLRCCGRRMPRQTSVKVGEDLIQS